MPEDKPNFPKKWTQALDFTMHTYKQFSQMHGYQMSQNDFPALVQLFIHLSQNSSPPFQPEK